MSTREDELEDFKRRISLVAYAADHGYDVDRRASSRNCIGMKHADGDKIIIGMGHDEHWIYFSVHDPADSGSIIDFVQRRQGVNLGQVRRELRPWIGASGTPGTPGSAGTPGRSPGSRPCAVRGYRADAGQSEGDRQDEWKPEPVVIDLTAVRDAYELAEPLESLSGGHAYLNVERAVPAALLASERFRGRVRVDQRGNAVFPHWNKDKRICGFEKKNRGFTGFASHGMKGLWCSAAFAQDRRMVIAETAIDALSYAALFGYDDARFFSIAGQMNPHQPALLNQAMQRMPKDSRVILAVDHDPGGDAIAEYIEPIYRHVCGMLGRTDIELVIDRPEVHGHDWNDVLRASGSDLGKANRPTAAPQPE